MQLIATPILIRVFYDFLMINEPPKIAKWSKLPRFALVQFLWRAVIETSLKYEGSAGAGPAEKRLPRGEDQDEV